MDANQTHDRTPTTPGERALDTQTERDAFRRWVDTHCYSCGGELGTPLSAMTEDELMDPDGPNSEHNVCFE